MISVDKIKLNAKIIIGPFLIMALFCFSSCFKEHEVKIIHLQGKTMGTTYNIKYVPSGSFPIDQKLVHQKIETILKDFNKVASTYDPSSEISKINQLEANIEISVSPIFKLLMKEAIEMNKLSQGVFDPSLSPLINLWGFGAAGKRSTPPVDQEVRNALKACGMVNFIFQKSSIRKNNSASELDFSAFAKGYGVDLIVLYLESVQMDDYFVEIGGEVRTRSKDKQWKIGIEKPDPAQRGHLTKIITLNGAIATSGDYRNFYNHAGKKYSHGINFRSGKPVENNIASVSVFHSRSAMRADAWATALMVSESFSEAIDLINKNNLSAFIIYREAGELKMYESVEWKKEFNND